MVSADTFRRVLAGLTEVAELLGVSKQRAAVIVETYDDFPEPAAVLAAGRVWEEADVLAWLAAHPDRKPGRPRR